MIYTPQQTAKNENANDNEAELKKKQREADPENSVLQKAVTLTIVSLSVLKWKWLRSKKQLLRWKHAEAHTFSFTETLEPKHASLIQVASH